MGVQLQLLQVLTTTEMVSDWSRNAPGGQKWAIRGKQYGVIAGDAQAKIQDFNQRGPDRHHRKQLNLKCYSSKYPQRKWSLGKIKRAHILRLFVLKRLCTNVTQVQNGPEQESRPQFGSQNNPKELEVRQQEIWGTHFLSWEEGTVAGFLKHCGGFREHSNSQRPHLQLVWNLGRWSFANVWTVICKRKSGPGWKNPNRNFLLEEFLLPGSVEETLRKEFSLKSLLRYAACATGNEITWAGNEPPLHRKWPVAIKLTTGR